MKRAWLPWIVLTLTIFIWSQPGTKKGLDGLFSRDVPVPGLHLALTRTPPVVPPDSKPEEALYKLNLLSATGTGILVAAVISGLAMGFTPLAMLRRWLATVVHLRLSLLTIASMMALGFVTKYSGTDATLGLALAKTGWLYPFFGTLLGWLGVGPHWAATHLPMCSSVRCKPSPRRQVGVSPALMAAANTTGGVMGKMIDAQSIVVASTGRAESLVRKAPCCARVFWHSIALAGLVGLLVMLQAYVWPFSRDGCRSRRETGLTQLSTGDQIGLGASGGLGHGGCRQTGIITARRLFGGAVDEVPVEHIFHEVPDGILWREVADDHAAAGG